jgi:hypothetical protein
LVDWRLVSLLQKLLREAAALDFVSDAFNHLKVIGHVPAAKPLLRAPVSPKSW